MSIILGIDIGISGALAMLNDVGDLLEVHDLPVLLDGACRPPRGQCAAARCACL